jgi:hypothetical protein
MRSWLSGFGWRQQEKRMMSFSPRLFPAALVAAALSFSVLPALAQSAAPADKSNPPENGKNTQKTDELAEAAAALNGPAGNPECVWLGRTAVSLLWRDDFDTAFRHLDLYDRFSCPPNHIQATYRCLVRQGPLDGKNNNDSLNARIHACWIKPDPITPAPATTTVNPARR